ncbi:MAG: lysine exporter LysO family protein [Synergistetes bacterium]|nr:lysine exporter LysO family protein [Synergistota bacterium]MCX8127600.1 lysine exporter LysO family protein [Synergistota bacterium]MDW8191483.1 lysine exporter LysO family protein [Synergistota bacterium]
MDPKPLLVLSTGIIIGYLNILPIGIKNFNSIAIKGALLALFIAIGIDMGKDSKLWESIKSFRKDIFTITFTGLAGSLLGGVFASLLLKIPLSIGVASAVGSGYYSLTTLILKEIGGPEQALIGFFSNILRELIVIVGMPLIAKFFGKSGSIAAAGATAMDTALPFIIKSVGKEIGIFSFTSGVIITILVPFLVPTIYRILSNFGW